MGGGEVAGGEGFDGVRNRRRVGRSPDLEG